MKSLKFIFLPRLVLVLLLSATFARAADGERVRHDLVVVGATPAGITAAIAAAREGRGVLVLERTNHIGGLPANGLGATDIVTRGATGGLFLEFTGRVRAHYAAAYGEKSGQVEISRDGYHFESSVAEKVLARMLAEHPAIEVRLMRQFDADPANVTLVNGRLAAIRVINRETGAVEEAAGRIFIDATYEGDLAAAAGAPYRVGREGRAEHGEALAGRLYKPWAAEPGPGSTGLADNAVQAYNYRLPLTKVPENRVPIRKPAAYNRDDYVSLIEDIRLNRDAAPVPPHPNRVSTIARILNIIELPNGKIDGNNHHACFISTDLPEENWPWPTSGWAWRDRFAVRLRDYTLGLLWFCQNDAELPEAFRADCSQWGLSRDEFADNGHFPRQVYVREGRRIMGEYLFTAADALPVAEGKRPPLHRDSITASHYALDSHPVRKREPGRGHLDGMFSQDTVPYTVPYGVIVPKGVDGLLVPVAVSATHVGLSTLRMEPCWMALGEAAGTAAHLSLAGETGLRNVSVNKIQDSLLRHGAVLVWFRDMKPSHPAWPVVQKLALRGAIEGWRVDADKPLDADTAAAWRGALGLGVASAPEITRGEYLGKLRDELGGAKD
ncbi:FAD-dependent oxidoreductase [Termitidicoccus mucosus]|uniref:FAD-dependent oxidoreductase n=1 Tax=Termitidicoccus mucosus TaxID=1184151 RepID=A0A178IMR6_9BACT|nr:hypothetical protein AW736_07340 [Opitutaceae bacterium TSB47]